DVTAGMPADKAGIKPADVIVAIDGKTVKDGQDLVGRISDMPVGTKVGVSVLRDKKKMEFEVTVGDRQRVVNGANDAERPGAPAPEESTPAKFGIEIERLTPERREAIGLPEKGGVLVSSVQPGSFAEDIGMVANDVILEINRQAVNAPADVPRIQTGLKAGDPVAIRVLRASAPIARRGARAPEWTTVFLAGTLRE
ncbi:MAG: PDZ domain-containing protein, partial [Bryobacteraceae bacterium]